MNSHKGLVKGFLILSLSIQIAHVQAASSWSWSDFYQNSVTPRVQKLYTGIEKTWDWSKNNKGKASIALLGLCFAGYKCYSFINDRLSTWRLNQANDNLPEILQKGTQNNNNAASSSQTIPYDLRYHIINLIIANRQTIRDVLFSLHNKGTTDSLFGWTNNVPQTLPKIEIEGVVNGVRICVLEIALNTQHNGFVVTLRNTMCGSNMSGNGVTLYAAILDFVQKVIEKPSSNPFDKEGTIKDMTQEVWNDMWCQNALPQYKIDANNNGTVARPTFRCITKVHHITEPANHAIELNEQTKQLAYFNQKCIDCFAKAWQLEQVSGVYTGSDSDDGFQDDDSQNDLYDFRYHLDQLVKVNREIIYNALIEQAKLGRESIKITGSLNNETFDLIIGVDPQDMLYIKLKNNQSDLENEYIGNQHDRGLNKALENMTSMTSDQLNQWCGQSLQALQVDDDEDAILEVEPQFTLVTNLLPAGDSILDDQHATNIKACVLDCFQDA